MIQNYKVTDKREIWCNRGDLVTSGEQPVTSWEDPEWPRPGC